MVNSLRAMHEEKSELEHQETASFSRETLKQISVIRTRLRHDTSHVLDPSGPYMRRWDLVTTFCLVFTAIVTPVEVGFVVQARPNPRTPLFWINRAIDCVFLKDIVLNFNLAYVDDTKGNMLVKSRRTIAKRWIKQLEHSKRDADGNKQFHGASVADCYFASLYFTVYTITSVGYGDINPVNRTEMVVNTLFIVTGAIIWAYIIGNFASLLSTVDVYGAQFRQSMDELNSRNMARVANYRKLEGMMSYALRGEAAAANNLMWLKRVWYLSSATTSCVVEISQCLGQMTFAPLEVVDIAHTLFVLRRGIASKRGIPFSKGTVWGEDFVLKRLDLADSACACALTYIEVLSLAAADLYRILRYFPAELARVRFAVAFYTVKSCLIRLGREHHRRAMVEAGLDPDEEDSKKVSAFEHLYMRKGHKIAAHTSSMAEVRPSVILNPVKVAPGRQSDAPPPASNFEIAKLAQTVESLDAKLDALVARLDGAAPAAPAAGGGGGGDAGPAVGAQDLDRHAQETFGFGAFTNQAALGEGRVVRRFTGRGSMVASRPAIKAIEETKAAEKRRRTRRSSFLPS
ncbi:voltage-gated potassium channel [Aureococcus anophagefferens]|nr:voltage-gated potassium channel [Aureococcus anophagefferens]